MNRIGERMSKEARPGHQPPLNILGCVALLNAIRTDRYQSRAKLRTKRQVSAS
jgi:hypothetical protein